MTKILGRFASLAYSRHGRYQCVAQLSLSQVMAFFWLYAVVLSCGAMLYVLNTQKLARNYPGHS